MSVFLLIYWWVEHWFSVDIHVGVGIGKWNIVWHFSLFTRSTPAKR